MRPLLPLLLVFAVGCAPKRTTWSDPSLPEATDEISVKAPLGVLAEGAASDDPSVRGRALDLLLRALPAADDEGWARRALWDPDPWVQRTAVEALADRLDEPAAVELLTAFVGRTDDLADPYARGAAALRLADAGHTDIAPTVSAAWADELPWRAAPLMLAALVLGDQAAQEPLAATLAQGEVGLEPDFLLDLGRSGQTALLPALADGQEWVEEEMALAWATARLELGDDDARKTLQATLDGDDPLAALEALDYLSKVDSDVSTTLIKKARSGGSDTARAYAELALAARGQADPEILDTALASPDPELRTLAARFASDIVQHPEAPRRARRIARRVLETALADDALHVRVAALRSAAALGVLVPEPPVRASLVDELLAVRIEAAGALLARGS